MSDDQLTSIGMLHERGVPIAGGTDALILGANPLEDIRNTRSLEPVTSEGRVVEGEALLREVG